MQQQPRERLFFAYPAAEEPFARALGRHLQSAGFDVLFDLWEDTGIEAVPKELEDALSGCSQFLYVLSPAAGGSKWSRAGFQALLYKKMKNLGLRILPLVRGNVPSPPLMGPLRHFDFRGFDFNDPAAFRTDEEGPFRDLMELVSRKTQKSGGELIPPGMATYEFAFQPRKGKPRNFDGTLNYELVLKNVKKDPLKNFAITVRFREPVAEMRYDKYRSSSAELGAGEGLSRDGRRFSWIVETFYGGGGFIIFNIRSRAVPEIERLSTRFIGRVAGTNRVIGPDPQGV